MHLIKDENGNLVQHGHEHTPEHSHAHTHADGVHIHIHTHMAMGNTHILMETVGVQITADPVRAVIVRKKRLRC